jgi:hypothetical protein
MSDLKDTMVAGFETRYKKLSGRVRDLASPLSDEQFWTKPFPFGNTFGHLVLHLTGNLKYYIGAQIAQTGYVRDRPREFTETTRPPKAETLTKFDDAIDIVLRTIRCQSPEDWSKAYTAVGSDSPDRFDIVLQCATHLDHHVGQMIYLAFELKRNK